MNDPFTSHGVSLPHRAEPFKRRIWKVFAVILKALPARRSGEDLLREARPHPPGGSIAFQTEKLVRLGRGGVP